MNLNPDQVLIERRMMQLNYQLPEPPYYYSPLCRIPNINKTILKLSILWINFLRLVLSIECLRIPGICWWRRHWSGVSVSWLVLWDSWRRVWFWRSTPCHPYNLSWSRERTGNKCWISLCHPMSYEAGRFAKTQPNSLNIIIDFYQKTEKLTSIVWPNSTSNVTTTTQ